MLFIRVATEKDKDSIWSLMEPIIRAGDTYVFDPQSPKEKLLEYWYRKDNKTYVAERDGIIVGTFLLRDNQPDLGNHFANAAYMVSSSYTREGIGREMALYSFDEARRLGYQAMQFNFVVSTNTGAVRLWKNLGFTVIGEIPEAFRHPVLGLVNAFIMYRKL